MQSLDTVKSESSTLNVKQIDRNQMVEDINVQPANFDNIQNQIKQKAKIDTHVSEEKGIDKKKAIIIGSIVLAIIILTSITVPIGIILGSKKQTINSDIKTEILPYKDGKILQSIETLSSGQQLQAIVTVDSLVVSNPYQQTSIKKLQGENGNIFEIFCNPLSIISTTLQTTNELSAEQNAKKNKWIDQYNRKPQVVYKKFLQFLFDQFEKLKERQPNFSGSLDNFAQIYMIYVEYDLNTSSLALATYAQEQMSESPKQTQTLPQNTNNEQLSPYLLEGLKNSVKKLIKQISIGVQFLQKKSYEIIQQQKKYRQEIHISNEGSFLQFCIGTSPRLFLCPWDIVREKFHIDDSMNLVSSSVTTFSLSIE